MASMCPTFARARGKPPLSFAPLFSILPLVLGAAAPAKSAAADPAASVLRVEVVISPHDRDAPWRLMSPVNGSASAFVIDHDRLLTNAHVVHEAQQITVKKNDGSAPALATVEAADEECDLAVLRVADKGFLAEPSVRRVS
jgi:S1-C subfamily serine protease